MTETATPAFSDISAQDTALAAQEAQEWIEAVTGRTFGSSFRKSLEDGVILCELMTKLIPDSIRKINRAKSPIAHLDNIQQFLFACKDLGLKDAQLFDKMDLQEAKGVKAKGVKRNEADRRIRSVCITLYWLGQTIAELEDYSGPQLDLDAFKRIMTGSSTITVHVHNANSNGMPSPKQVEQHNHYQLPVDKTPSPTRTTPPRLTQPPRPSVNGLTSEQEQTADELLDDIQKTVDQMLLDCQSSPIVSPEPPSPSPASAAASRTTMVDQLPLSKKVGMTISMFSINGGFGFRIVGGRDISADIVPQVDLVAPGLAADKAGLKEGDQIVSVNRQDVTSLKHEDLVSMIKRAGAEGSVTLGVIRSVEQERGDPPSYQMEELDSAPVNRAEPTSMWEESRESWEVHQREQERRAQEIALMYRRGPPPTVGSRPLPPLVEHQEESVLENIIELMESTPVPPPQSSSPSPPPSPPTPTISPPQLFSERQAAQTTEIQDDRESIERELQELAMMEMAKPQEQSEEESSLASSSKHSGHTAESPQAVRTEEKEVSEKRAENKNLPPATATEQNAAGAQRKESKGLDAHLQELLELTEKMDREVTSVPFIESPPPPLPQTEAPKRQTQKDTSSQPATRPKPVRKAPSPPKPKPKKESILSQRTRLPTQPSSEVKQTVTATVRTEPSPAVKEEKEEPKVVPTAKPEPRQKEEEPVKKVEPKEEQEKSRPSRKLSFTPPPPPTTPPTSPTPPEPIVEQSEPTSTTTISEGKVDRPEPVAHVKTTTTTTVANVYTTEPVVHATTTVASVSSSTVTKHTVTNVTDYTAATAVPEPVTAVPQPIPQPVTTMPQPIPQPVTAMPQPIPQPVTAMPQPITQPVTVVPQPVPQPVTTMPQPVPQPVTTMPQPSLAVPEPTIISTPSTSNNSVDEDVADITAPTATLGTPEVKPTSLSVSAPVTPAQKSDGGYHKEEMRALTSEDVEIIGGMKISRVQRTKWTPKGSLTEFVTPPKAQTKGPFQDQIEQHYLFRMPDDGSVEGVRYAPSETHKPGSRRAEVYQQRYVQPDRDPGMGNFDHHPSSRGAYHQQPYDTQQQQQVDMREARHQQWSSQEELRHRHQQQQQQHHAAGYQQQQQSRQKTPPQQQHHPHYHHQQQQRQPQQQPQSQYTPNHHGQQPYRQQKSTPNGHTAGHGGRTGNGGYKSASLPRNMHDSLRVNRSNTWTASDRQPKDGPQSAYAVKAGNPYELCSRCHQMLGGGPVMAIPGAKTQYHLQCFVCRMCRNPLVGTVPKNTVVIMKSRHPHCHRCVSNKKDTVMTEC